MDPVQHLALWLANEAPHKTIKALFAGFCQEMVQSGVPVWRASLGLEGLHPEVSGQLHVWEDQSASVQESDRATAPTGAPGAVVPLSISSSNSCITCRSVLLPARIIRSQA
jgi:hypothetical protein